MLFAPKAAFASAIPNVRLMSEDANFADLLGETPDFTRVEVVIAPLIGKTFDAFELILKLAAANFQGRFQVISGKLANAPMVLRELQSVAAPFKISVDLKGAA